MRPDEALPRLAGAALCSLLLATSARAQGARRATPLSPAEAAVKEGIALLEQDRVPEARERFERAVALDPGSADGHYMLGWLREQSRDLEGAASEYEAALAHAPGRAAIHDR